MKHLSEILPTIAPTANSANAPHAMLSHGSISKAGSMTTRLESSRQAGLANAAMISEIANLICTSSLWRIKHTAEDIKKRMRIFEEAQTIATKEDCAYWLTRFVSHFVPRSPEQHAVIIGDIAAGRERYGITIIGLVVALIELVESSTKDSPFLPPTGEIINKIKLKCRDYSDALECDKRQLSRLSNQGGNNAN